MESVNKKLLLIGGGIVLVVIVGLVASGSLKFNFAISPSNSSNLSLKSYTHTASGVNLQYPQGWSIKEDPASSILVAFGSPKEGSDDDFVDNINISTANLPSGSITNVEQLTQSWISETENTPGFSILERSYTTMAGEQAEKLVYTYTNQGKIMQGLVVITFKSNVAYVITYTATQSSFPNFVQAADAVVASLEVN